MYFINKPNLSLHDDSSRRGAHLNVLIQVEDQSGGGEEGDAEQGAGRLHRGLPVKGALEDFSLIFIIIMLFAK